MTAPTDQDRAVARRVLRRIVGAGPTANVRLAGANLSHTGGYVGLNRRRVTEKVHAAHDMFDAAVDGACAGREYRANELKRDADDAHARVEGHTLDRQIAHLTKGSK